MPNMISRNLIAQVRTDFVTGRMVLSCPARQLNGAVRVGLKNEVVGILRLRTGFPLGYVDALLERSFAARLNFEEIFAPETSRMGQFVPFSTSYRVYD